MSRAGFALGILLLLAACGPRVTVTTGTTIGLKASPGDGQTSPPQVTLGYKRAEVALVPTRDDGATPTAEAASVLATFHFKTEWIGKTGLDSFVATGFAASTLTKSAAFKEAVSQTVLGQDPKAVAERQARLLKQAEALSEDSAKSTLQLAGYQPLKDKTSKDSLKEYIGSARTFPLLERLESAFNRVR